MEQPIKMCLPRSRQGLYPGGSQTTREQVNFQA